MKLENLLEDVEIFEVLGDINLDISSLSFDSENCKNALYFCLVGTKFDGHDFAKSAQKNGAAAIITERILDVKIPQIRVQNCRQVMSRIAANFYLNPQRSLKMIGITGTNGKTTSTFMIKSILESAGYKVGLIGTNGAMIGDKKLESKLTTPDPTDLYKLLYDMKRENVTHVVMEVSAHAIALSKTDGINFEAGIFSNLTQDHLDYFKTMENYASVKQQFLTARFCKNCIINIDDNYGAQFFDKCDCNKLSSGLVSGDIWASDIKCTLRGSEFYVNYKNKKIPIKLNLAGKFNVYNALGASAACKILGVTDEAIAKGLGALKSVDGRFNVISRGFDVVIDYAHSPDGMQNILRSVKEICRGRLVCVFGCGGDRDSLKRPIMGKIASELCDVVFVTSDNPRSENPQDIINQILAGINKKTDVFTVENRKQAIISALSLAEDGDCVVICGKGAEDYQEIKGVKYTFSDRIVVEEFFNTN